MRRPRFDPHRVINQIKYWAIEITILVLFLKWLGGSLWHELGFDHSAEAKAAQSCVVEQPRR
ncbi:MAG TPA: hypothetical protein VGN17_05000 [Bryobacteraceae bacterium]